MKNGFTLIEVLVGTFLMLIVFIGIFGAFQLGLKVVGQSKAKITATALANQKIEMARNLPYNAVGIEGGYPDGEIEASENIPINNIQYTVDTDISYVIDEADGLTEPEDNCINDYKRVRVSVSWSGRFGGEVSLASDVSPKNEVQECEETGGILWVKVFDAKGEKIEGAAIQVKDVYTELTKQCITSLNTKCYIPLPASLEGQAENYKIEVTKTGYSQEQTFGSGETYNSQTIISPEKSNTTISEGQITEISFSIDELSSFSIDTKSSREIKTFDDEFNNFSKISDYSGIALSEGEVKLAKTNGNYISSGYLVSTEISPAQLVNWDKLSWSDSEPTDTNIKYQLFYLEEENWILIPDQDLTNNSLGFEESPVDISGLALEQYSALKTKGNLSTEDLTKTPSLSWWSITYATKISHPVGSVEFNIQGEKLIGTDAQEQPIYKYSNNHISGPNGHLDILNLEWDSYTFSAAPASDLTLVETVPAPQPIGLSPSTNQSAVLYFEAENNLLVKVQDFETSEPIFSAEARLHNSDLGYDKTQLTNGDGETYFIPLEAATYNLEVTAEGYDSYSGQISISGDVTALINLTLSPG